MKKVVWTLGMLALTVSMAHAQDGAAKKQPPAAPAKAPAAAADHAALDTALIANEHKINDAIAKGDKAAFQAQLSPDSLGADANGFMKTSDFVPMLDQIKIKDWKMSDEKVTWVDANTAILTYKWTGSGTFHGQPVPTQTYASTVWTKKGGTWVAVFHQETEAAKAAPAKK